MKTKLFIYPALAFLTVYALFSVIGLAQTGKSPMDPIPIGTAVKTEIHCGDSAGSMEPYDASITVLQVLRGNEAWNLLKEANPSNKQPQTGYEYILVRLSFTTSLSISGLLQGYDALNMPSQFGTRCLRTV